MKDEKLKIFLMDSILLFNSIYCLNSSSKIKWNKITTYKKRERIELEGAGIPAPFFCSI